MLPLTGRSPGRPGFLSAAPGRSRKMTGKAAAWRLPARRRDGIPVTEKSMPGPPEKDQLEMSRAMARSTTIINKKPWILSVSIRKLQLGIARLI